MTNRSRAAQPEALCLAHPIQLRRPETTSQVQAGSQATVECQVQHRQMQVTQCQECERFKRVEVHEGAYVLLCRA
jgi:hypothetical protein